MVKTKPEDPHVHHCWLYLSARHSAWPWSTDTLLFLVKEDSSEGPARTQGLLMYLTPVRTPSRDTDRLLSASERPDLLPERGCQSHTGLRNTRTLFSMGSKAIGKLIMILKQKCIGLESTKQGVGLNLQLVSWTLQGPNPLKPCKKPLFPSCILRMWRLKWHTMSCGCEQTFFQTAFPEWL